MKYIDAEKKKIKKSLDEKIQKVKKIKKGDVLIFVLLLLSAIVFILFLRNYNPVRIVDYLGMGNIYLITFLLAVLGGVSFLTATYFYMTVILFILGGSNPLVLALFAASGLTIGDLFFYLVGTKGSFIFKDYFKKNKDTGKIVWLERKMKKHEFLVIYLYAGFLPIPKDILSFVLGFFEHRVKNIVLPLFLGNLTQNILFGYMVLFGFL